MYMPTLARFTALDPLPPDGEPILLGTSSYGYVRNNPKNLVDPSGRAPERTKTPPGFPHPPNDIPSEVKGCSCGEALNCLVLAGLDACSQGNLLAKEALAEAQASGLEGPHNGKQDAFRHCYWACRMTAAFGRMKAKTIGDLHEECGQNPPNETCMDLWNNAIGRREGDLIQRTGHDPKEECRSRCLGDIALLQNSVGCPPGTGTPYENGD